MQMILRNARPWGRDLTDVAVDDGRIAAIGQRLHPNGAPEFDCAGDLLLPGLQDHHLHILALAARRQSVELSGILGIDALIHTLQSAPAGPWVRATGYDERVAGLPDTALLDRWMPDRPLRLQDRTGALWVFNTAALSQLDGTPWPAGAERNDSGQLTGRFWREDAWLARALPKSLPNLSLLGAELAALGLTGLTDAGAHNGPDEAELLSGALPQRLTLMGSEALTAGTGYTLGPLKLLLDERDLPDILTLAGRIAVAHGLGRAVAAHCVTEGELLVFLAALEEAGGALAGDRIEHGALIGEGMIPLIAATPLTVVSNPAFIHVRGDRYRETVAANQWADLYRAASLVAAGIPLLAGSDAPYANVDPWLAMRTARDRLTASGLALGLDEQLPARAALQLYCAHNMAPGDAANLIVCRGSLSDVLADLSAQRVRATMIAGVWR